MDRDERNKSRGEKHHTAKLTADDVRLMRDLFDHHGLSTRDLAKKFEVSQKAAHKVVSRESWGHVL